MTASIKAMRPFVLALVLVIVSLTWYCGYLQSKADIEVSRIEKLQEKHDRIMSLVKDASQSYVWNYEAVKDILKSDLSTESKERRQRMVAILHVYKFDSECEAAGLPSPYAESMLYDLRAEYQRLKKAEGMLEEMEMVPAPTERTLILPE